MTALDFLLSRQPWLITSEALTAMASQAVAFFDRETAPPEPPENPRLAVEDGVGIIRLRGPLNAVESKQRLYGFAARRERISASTR